MTKYKHIVYVHPVANSKPNLHKVEHENEFETEYDAKVFIMDYNLIYKKTQAVYYGEVNTDFYSKVTDSTGEIK